MNVALQGEYLIVYEVTCPDCNARHFLLGWNPGYCPWCGADVGGASKERLQAQKHYFKPTVNPLTGEPVILPESA